MEKLLEAKQVAEILGCCLPVAKRHMQKMQCINIGLGNKKVLRVRESVLGAYIANLESHCEERTETTTRKKKTPVITNGCDEYGRTLRKRNGELVAMKTPPKHVPLAQSVSARGS